MHKTEKDQPGAKELHGSWKANREGGKPPAGRGGQVNLVRLAAEESLEDADFTCSRCGYFSWELYGDAGLCAKCFGPEDPVAEPESAETNS
jgi:hypothetical protein